MADGFDPVRHRLGVAYDDDCLELGLTWRRDYETTGDARRGNSFLLIRVALKQSRPLSAAFSYGQARCRAARAPSRSLEE